MIAVTVDGNSLVVATEAGSAVLRGVHRAYFETILNLHLRSDDSGYEVRGAERLGDLLQDICEYLETEGLEYQLDDNARRILQRTRGAAQQLAEAIAAGRDVLAAPPEQLRIPGFVRELLPHQWTPVRHLLAVPNAANFSVMGAGKTTVVLAAFHELRSQGVVDCLLVIGPGSSFMPWEEEFRTCFGRRPNVVRLSGTPEEREDRYHVAEEAELVLVTYHTAARDQGPLSALMRRRRTMLILDESHWVKGSGALADAVLLIAPEAERRVILTGTPVPHSYADLWTQLSFLWPDQRLLGNRVQFRNQIATDDGEEQVRRRVRPLFTRVRKTDLGLPQPWGGGRASPPGWLWCALSARQRSHARSAGGGVSGEMETVRERCLNALYWHRLLDTDQLHRMHSPESHPAWVRRQLRELWGDGYVDKIAAFRATAQAAVWFLTPAGVNLAEEGRRSLFGRCSIWRKRRRRPCFLARTMRCGDSCATLRQYLSPRAIIARNECSRPGV